MRVNKDAGVVALTKHGQKRDGRGKRGLNLTVIFDEADVSVCRMADSKAADFRDGTLLPLISHDSISYRDAVLRTQRKYRLVASRYFMGLRVLFKSITYYFFNYISVFQSSCNNHLRNNYSKASMMQL